MKESKKIGIIKEDALKAIALLLGMQLEELEGKSVSVYKYENPTDGCICPGHIAVSLEPERKTFFGIPQQAVAWS